MKQYYLRFLRGISANWMSMFGSALVTSTIVGFLFFEILTISGVIHNAYVGLITYLAFPALFITGLLLIPLGLWIEARRKGKSIKMMLAERFDQELLTPKRTGSLLLKTVGILTIFNLIILGLASTRMLHFMESANFCGTACHSVMGPEWATYQQSPHARVACVDCHVGEGLGGLVDSKINGAWQMISVTFDLYEKPIPTPVHNLRPARNTCEKCHWPEMFHGDKIKQYIHFENDSTSAPTYTTLMMKIGSGKIGQSSGSHWHVSPENEVRYASLNDQREEIAWIDVRQPGGSYKRFSNQRLEYSGKDQKEYSRTMDCVDCHNRATHIYELPSEAIDLRIAQGLIDRSLPFAKSIAMTALMANYPDYNSAKEGIAKAISRRYNELLSVVTALDSVKIAQLISAVQSIHLRNIHPGMNVKWGSYPNHLGHSDGRGCFRCHNPNMVDEKGIAISMDCTMCHSILANGSPRPFDFLYEGSEIKGAGKEAVDFLVEEFRQSYTH